MKTVIKRDNTKEEFNRYKIEEAIFGAMINCEENITDEEAKNKSQEVTSHVMVKLMAIEKESISIEDIQDIVEDVLMDIKMPKTSKGYIRYRFQREALRNDKLTVQSVSKLMASYISKADWQVKENSNMDYSLQGLNNYIANEFTKSFFLDHVFSKEQKHAHESGDIHIHDLGTLATYCCGWDLEALLTLGFTGVKNKTQSAPAKHLRTALGQLVNYFYTMQGEAAGAQAVSSFDTYLAPFIRYDNLDYPEVKQMMQEFIFNLNVPTRVGFQTPFTNLTMDLSISPLLKDKPVIIGGKHMEETYGEFKEEMDMINKAFCEVMMAGDASGRIFTFPIPTYNITKDFDWDAPIVTNIMEMTSKYGIPYFSNYINSDMNPEDARSMCCRLRLDNRVLRKRGGGLFGANPLTGSIGIITVNLPRLGYKHDNIEDFKNDLEKILDMCHNILETKRKLIEKNTREGLYPYSKFYLKDVYDRFGEYFKNHFNTIGVIGMNECIRNFFDDKEDITTEVGQKFTNDILDFMNNKLTEFQENGDLYNLEATPGEGTAYRLPQKDLKLYKDILTAGIDEPYYTNSTQLPVEYTHDLFEVLRLQDDIQCKYTGGTVLHGYMGEQINDPEVTKKFIKNVFENYRLPYLSITPTFSVCPKHGYLNGEQESCPTCGSETEIWTRVVGYYRPIQSFNKGKRREYHERTCYQINE